jgi:cytochrome o ubiquinol oxidase operon protein cyoD
MSKPVVSQHGPAHGSARSYTIGFGLSLALTLSAYFLTVTEKAHGWSLIFILTGLALAQLLVQLIFFLHLGKESKPWWNTSVLVFAGGVVVVVVFGSLWIMYNLDYNHGRHQPSPQEIIKDEGYHAAP